MGLYDFACYAFVRTVFTVLCEEEMESALCEWEIGYHEEKKVIEAVSINEYNIDTCSNFSELRRKR